MSDQYWKNEYPDHQDPWDRGTYQTGSTQPPKPRGVLVAVLLALVIFLCGIVSALSLLNIRLFRAVIQQPKETGTAVSFDAYNFATEPEETPITASLPSAPAGDVELELNGSPESLENIPQEGGLSLQEIYERNIASVVSISCTGLRSSSSGTGVVISKNGYIVTNCHVVEGANAISVLFTDNRTMDAVIVGTDPVSDLAVLYVQATDLTPAQFGDSASLRVGDSVVAIGDPLGVELRGTMTNGIVSAINRDITTEGRTMTLIQTNAALNSGNSGGPLINCYGQVIGINTMKIGDYMSSAGVEGLGFAIPSTTVKEIVDQLIAQGYVSGRPYLGITGQAVSGFDQLYYRLPQGIYITAVDENSDAAAKGIAPGDVLLQVGDTRITDTDTLQTALYAQEAGDTVTVVIYRSGRQYALEITLGQSQ